VPRLRPSIAVTAWGLRVCSRPHLFAEATECTRRERPGVLDESLRPFNIPQDESITVARRQTDGLAMVVSPSDAINRALVERC